MAGNLSELTLEAQICEVGSRLWQRGLISAFDGNISCRMPDGLILCTPTGIAKGFLSTEDLVVIDLEGKIIRGKRKPSSEILMHLEILRRRHDVNAVLHAHPPCATGFAVAGHAIPSGVMPEIDFLLGEVPVLPYRKPGTQDLADSFTPFLLGPDAAKLPNAFLLGNHGATVVGECLETAWHRMESLELCCQILLKAKALGGWKPL